MKALMTLLLQGWLGLVWCCQPQPGSINIATSGEASQSSTAAGNADLANDGVRYQNWHQGSCTDTTNQWEPWWRLDLMEKQNVYVIVVYGRSDCCLERMRGLEIRIGDSPDNNNPLCGTITDYNNTITTFCCNGMAGRYISAVIPGRTECMNLCEMEVYNGTRTENDVCW